MSHIPASYGIRAGNVLMTEVMEELNDRDLTFESMYVSF